MKIITDFGNRFKRIFLAIFVFFSVTQCSTMQLDQFQNKQPLLKLEEYFNGHTEARGVFEDRFGNIKKSFKVDIRGTWDGKYLVLKEDFIYDDGTKDYREWKIEKIGNNQYQGFAPGVIGMAAGSTSGNAFNWKYDFDLPVGSSKYKVSFDDWMFLQDKTYLINIASMSKFGINIGKVILFFNKK
jgi:hypothetical protein